MTPLNILKFLLLLAAFGGFVLLSTGLGGRLAGKVAQAKP